MKANNYISKIAYGLAVAAGICWMSACSNDTLEVEQLTPEQQALIGKGVHFEPYVYGYQTRAFNHDGFNQNDVFYICRQALDETQGKYEPEEKWKSYYYKANVDQTGHIIDYQWVINTKNNAGWRGTTQSDKDSIFWENGKQVRFRAYSKSSCCDDYLYADWAYVSGPMSSVPLEFKHLGCRIGFAPFPGNTLTDEINFCIDPKDYMREDNADSHTDADENDKYSEERAKEIAAEVKAVYEKICMPGGLALYEDAGNNWYKRDETGSETKEDVAQPTYQYGQLTAKAKGETVGGEVVAGKATADNTERPNWKTNMDGIRYCIMIPYEMGAEKVGQPITIPADTRFRIRLKDVNTNDAEVSIDNNNNNNGGYHIFSLRDIKVLAEDGKTALKDEDGKEIEKYPNGITLRAGYSYTFYVGYYYKRLVVKVNEEGINWSTGNDSELTAEVEKKETTETKYEWWTTEMNRAAEYAMRHAQDVYEPHFIITNKEEWMEFTNLVNGNVPQYNGATKENEKGEKVPDYEGCITYFKFHPANGIIPKYKEEVLLEDPFPFTKMKVTLQCDIDFQDEAITSIGGGTVKGKATQFCGQFNGAGYTLSNFTGTVFGKVCREAEEKNNATVKGLYLKSSQKIRLINDAENVNIMGISVQGPSQHAITTTSNNCNITMCCHVGIGTGNGSLLGTATNCKITSSFIAAAENGSLTEDKEGAKTTNTFVGCYFDKTLSPKTNALGMKYPEDVDEYTVRGVLSQTLRAVKDKMHSSIDTKPELNQFYGPAPYKNMNALKGDAAANYKYIVTDATNYCDRYPTMQITKETDVKHPEMPANPSSKE